MKHYSRPLHWAAYCGHVEVIQLLAARGAEINSQDSGKETPLHRAARVGRTAAVKVLLSLGADRSIKNDKGKTAEDVASGDARSALKTDTESNKDKGKGSMFKRMF